MLASLTKYVLCKSKSNTVPNAQVDEDDNDDDDNDDDDDEPDTYDDEEDDENHLDDLDDDEIEQATEDITAGITLLKDHVFNK